MRSCPMTRSSATSCAGSSRRRPARSTATRLPARRSSQICRCRAGPGTDRSRRNPPPWRPLPRQMARIKMVDEADAAGPLAELYAAAKSRSVAKVVPDILETIARHAYRVTDEQVQRLRDAGWTDEQIAEAAYDAALFNLFVRLADTFGIEPPAVYEPDGIPAAARPE